MRHCQVGPRGWRGGQEVLVYNSVYSTKRNSSTQVVQLHNHSWMNDIL